MRRSAHWLATLLLLALAPLPRLALASCSFVNGTGMTRVQFSTPSQISVPNNVTPGTVLWSSPMTAQDADVEVYCNRRTTGGITNYLGVQPAPGATIFATNIPGLGIRLARGSAGNYLMATPNDYLTSGTTTFSISTSLELVATGSAAIPNGSSLYAGQLAHWDFGNLSSVVVFQTRNMTTFVRPACTVTVDPTVVNLRAVTANELQGGAGATAADTPFAIQLSCPSALTLQITLDANAPYNLANGVLNIASGGSAASGVGVQLTKDGQPVALRQAISVNTHSGAFAIPFAARYYRTGGTLKPGLVNATATYTLTYP